MKYKQKKKHHQIIWSIWQSKFAITLFMISGLPLRNTEVVQFHFFFPIEKKGLTLPSPLQTDK